MSRLILITGPSSSGKTTLAKALNERLREIGVFSLHMDGMEFRKMLSEMDFTKESILKMEDFIVNFTKVMKEKEVLLIYSLVAHRKRFRDRLKNEIPTLHLHLKAPIDVLKERDSKGVYEKADKNEMLLPGYNEPFEKPINSDLEFDTSKIPITEEIEIVLKKLKERGWLK